MANYALQSRQAAPAECWTAVPDPKLRLTLPLGTVSRLPVMSSGIFHISMGLPYKSYLLFWSGFLPASCFALLLNPKGFNSTKNNLSIKKVIDWPLSLETGFLKIETKSWKPWMLLKWRMWPVSVSVQPPLFLIRNNNWVFLLKVFHWAGVSELSNLTKRIQTVSLLTKIK